MSKNRNIKVLTQKDKNTLQAFANVHCLTKKHLTEDLKQNDRRIQSFKKDGYIKEKSYFNHSTKNTENYFVLTQKGKLLTEDKIDVEYFYNSNSAGHDIVLADRYFDLGENERSTWITEIEQRDTFAIADGSPCDGGYINSDGEMVLVEVITQNYSKEMREEKIEYAQNVGAKYEEVRG